MESKQGKCVIFSAPSGAGKTTIVHALLNKIPSLAFSVFFSSKSVSAAICSCSIVSVATTGLDINSFSKRDILFKPLSWGVELSYERFKSENDYLKLKPSFGLTYGTDDYFVYALAQSNLYNKFGDNLLSIGSKTGFITNKFKDIKLGLSYDYDKYNKGFENRTFEAFSTYKLKDDLSFNLKYVNDNLTKQRDVTSFSLLYYF